MADDEYRRLLYVGMTRAEDRLIVCGYHGKLARSPATWHSIVERALVNLEQTEARTHEATGETVFRYRSRVLPPVDAEEKQAEDEAAMPPDLPTFGELEKDDDLPRPLSPSGAFLLIDDAREPVVSERSPVLDGIEETGFAAARGSAIHKLLQVLPDMPEDAREAAARRFLERAAADWEPAQRAEAWAQVEKILGDPDFAPLFSPGSRAEVAIMGQIEVRGRQRQVSGKLDRLAVTETDVLIVDYKTNRPPPATLAEIPPAYVLQLALYKALLGPLYPGRAVRAALLFTETPKLFALPDEALDAALARLTRA